MKISINETKIIVNKDYGGASIRSSQDYSGGPVYVSLFINDLTIDHKAFQILDASFKNCETVNVKFFDGYDRSLNMVVRSQDVVLDAWNDIPTASFNLETKVELDLNARS